MPLLQLNLSGRMGNCLFEFAHARAYCEQNGYDLCMLPWVGERIFSGVPEAIRPGSRTPDIVWTDRLFQHQHDLIYTRKQVRQWFTFIPEIVQSLKPTDPDAVILNVRQGQDYRDAGLVTLSKQCYGEFATRFGYSPDHCFFETDLHPTTHPQFRGDFSAGGFGVTPVGIPSFYLLMTAKVLFRANSTFAWWAATLGHGTVYSPVIKGIRGGVPDAHCDIFVEGNWPVMCESSNHSDLHIKEE